MGENKSVRFSWRRVWIAITILFFIVVLAVFGVIAQAKVYKGRVLPGVYIGSVAIGGMNESELEDFLRSMNNKLLDEGFHFSLDIDGKTERFFLSPVIVMDDMAIELMSIDVKKETARLVNYGKTGDIIDDLIIFEKLRFEKPSIKLENIAVAYDRLKFEIVEKLSNYEKNPSDAGVKINSLIPLTYEIVSSTDGIVFQYDEAIKNLREFWTALEAPDVKIEYRKISPTLKEEQVQNIISRLPAVLENGNLTVTYKDPETKRAFEWYLSVEKIAAMLNAQKISDDKYGFGLNKGEVMDFLQSTIKPKVDLPTRDAKFKVDDKGKVVEFQGSRSGVEVNMEETYKLLNDAILQRTMHNEGITKTVQLAVKISEPNVTTGESNDLGIKEAFGAGISDFKGSPVNRIKNIKNAVEKLNGILIKPDEEFSAIKYTKPFTEEGGYLPELVIKGDEIKPEIGGGLCQIGTTLFRMAMNSGMPITQRRNHSLVVNYYNDLTNGLPGTDATFYDPAPDFKFKNDTGKYLLIQTYLDEEKKQLVFTLWGTNDGRKGWYDPPEVKKWIDYGETKYIETTNLPVGKTKCQHAYRGAEAQFKYLRQLPNGETEETVFESYYRPLPEICLVGVEEKVENCFTPDGVATTECPFVSPLTTSGTPIIVE